MAPEAQATSKTASQMWLLLKAADRIFISVAALCGMTD
jgi:hypothetical protein